MALGDLLQVTSKQRLFGQSCLNVFHYRVTSITGLDDTAYSQMWTWFLGSIGLAMRNIQSSVIAFESVEIRNLSNGVDFYEQPFTATGNVAATEATTLPSAVSIGFKLVRESLVTRNGYKRFAGVPEAWVTGNNYTPPSPTTTTAMETALAADWIGGLITLAEPVIVRRPLVPPVGTSYVYSSIGSAACKGTMGSQNTRKPGRGI